ncbi:SIS domain-containing protein [Phreatobacter sp.]|uniref:SIS domain-containing protein n=1 Tax=Phreatobacter sp. TaxID=1966341 RepID=UPI003F6F1E78
MPIPAFIREQPEALDRCLAATRGFAASWTPDAFHGIALVGSGSSFNALIACRPRFVAARRGPVLVHDPEDFIAELADLRDRPLVIVLSQSGASATSVAAAQAAVQAGLTTLAITASPEAPLGRSGAAIMPLPVGAEPVGPKTKGFTGSLVVLSVMAEALGAPALRLPSGADFAPLVEPALQWADDLVPGLADVDQIVIAGRRAGYGIALEASLKIAEMAGIPSAAYPTEELLHGRLHGLTGRSATFIIAGTDTEAEEARRVETVMARRGCRVIAVGPASMRGNVSGGWPVPGLVLPFQWLAVRLAEARGLQPETMRHGGLSAELAIKMDARP